MVNWLIAGSKKPDVVKLDIVVNWSMVVSKKPEVVKLDIMVNWIIAGSKKPVMETLDSVVNWSIVVSKKPGVVKLDILWLLIDCSQQEAWGGKAGHCPSVDLAQQEEVSTPQHLQAALNNYIMCSSCEKSVFLTSYPFFLFSLEPGRDYFL